MNARKTNESAVSVHVFAAFCGWLMPGLGHYLIGQKKRGIVIGCTISTLWLAGLLIGGVTVIDRYGPVENGVRRMPLPFLGQVLVAPSCFVAALNSGYLQPTYGYPPPAPGFSSTARAFSAYSPSYGRMNEQGVLYTALAGLLNLLVLIDVVYRDDRGGDSLVSGASTC